MNKILCEFWNKLMQKKKAKIAAPLIPFINFGPIYISFHRRKRSFAMLIRIDI